MDIAALRAAGARHLIQSELLSDVAPAADGPIFVRAAGAGPISISIRAGCDRRWATTTRA